MTNLTDKDEIDIMRQPWTYEHDVDSCYIVSNGISDYFCYGLESAKWLVDSLNKLLEQETE